MSKSYLRADTSEVSSALQFALLADPVPKGHEIRELTKNGIEAILEGSGEGRICWQVDTDRWPAPKLQIIDDGIGFDPDRMEVVQETLFGGNKELGRGANFGIGGRIAGLKASPAGVVYDSWRDGTGFRMVLRWPKREGPAFPERFPDGRHIRGLDEGHPWGAASGTRVTLIGESEDDDSSQPPPGLPGAALTWVYYYLDRRFCRWPDGIRVVVDRGSKAGRSQADAVRGLWTNLSDCSQAGGIVELPNQVLVRWWVLPEVEQRSDPRHYVPSHVGVVWGDELYDSASGIHLTRRLGNFGVVLATQRVAIQVVPRRDRWHPDAQRAHLLSSAEDSIPWQEWGAEFRERLPSEIAELEAELHSKAYTFDGRAWFKLLREMGLLELQRYYGADGDVAAEGSRQEPAPAEESDRKNGAGGSSGGEDRPSIFDKGTKPRTPRPPKGPPNIEWLDGADTGGEVARFAIDQNEIVCDPNHPLVARLERLIAARSNGHGNLAHRAARHAVSRRLLEHCLSVEALKHVGWDKKQINDAWSAPSLTASVATQYDLLQAALAQLRTQKGRDELMGSDK